MGDGADRTFRAGGRQRAADHRHGRHADRRLQGPGARINGRDDRRVQSDIAIIDSGVDVTHPDVNVTGGVDCSGPGTFSDGFGHGAFVAGTAAAIDNGIGSVGAAPGASVWSVRVVSRSQNIRESNLLCAFEWVTRNADVLEIANISIGGGGADLGRCGLDRRGRLVDPLHAAICAAVSRGVTVTASAGNAGIDAAGETPAAYDEVITVSAYTDFDGRPGGLTPESCFGLPRRQGCASVDPSRAAMGWPTVRAPPPPFVAGAAALLLARRPTLTPAQVRSELIARGEPGPLAQDPDPSPSRY
jgi:subtilisin family serine protease